MNKEELKNLIESKEENFLKKLKLAGLNELEYWEKRPENLSREILVRYLNSIDESREFYPDNLDVRVLEEFMERLALNGSSYLLISSLFLVK